MRVSRGHHASMPAETDSRLRCAPALHLYVRATIAAHRYHSHSYSSSYHAKVRHAARHFHFSRPSYPSSSLLIAYAHARAPLASSSRTLPVLLRDHQLRDHQENFDSMLLLLIYRERWFISVPSYKRLSSQVHHDLLSSMQHSNDTA